jgi:hypothetical protein
MGSLGILLLAGSLGCHNLLSTKALNNPPTITSTPPKTLSGGKSVKPGLTYLYAPAATDPDVGDNISFTLTAGPPNASLAEGVLRWTPTLEQAGIEQPFIISASDGKESVSQAFTIPVEFRSPPSGLRLDPVGTATPVELHPFTWVLSFADDDPASVTITVASPAGTTFNSVARTLTWTPPTGTIGVTEIQLEVKNNVGQAAQLLLNVTVEKNKAPLLTYVGSATSVVEGDFIAAPFTVLDPNGDPINSGLVSASVTYQGQPATPSAQVSWDAINGVATISWTPALFAAYRGRTVGLNLSAGDGFGATNTLSIPLLVNPNLPPVITAVAGNASSVVEGSTLNLRFTITDPNGDLIGPSSLTSGMTFQGQPLAPNPILTWDSFSSVANVSWTPPLPASYVGQDVLLTLSATDVKGARTTQDFSLRVKQNSPPTFTPDPGNPSSVKAGVTATFAVIILDPDGDAVMASSVTGSTLYLGSPASPAPTTTWDPLNRRATVTWTPSALGPYLGGTATLRITAADSKGASAFKDLQVNVTP